MSETQWDLLTRLTDHMNAHDLDAVYGMLHEDYREYFNGVLVKEGPVATRAADQFVYDAVPDYRREVDYLYADEGGGAMFWRFLGTGPNGPIEMRAASNLRVKDGKVIESWIYADPGDARSVGGA